MAELDETKVPLSARSLIPLARRWGLGDDFEREDMVSSASDEELQSLIRAGERLDEDFWNWLAGSESLSPSPSLEYVTMTAFTMAIDSARVRLQAKRQGT